MNLPLLPGEEAMVPEETARYVVATTFDAIKRLADSLKDAQYEGMTDKDKGQLLAYLGKALNDIVRLRAFDRGEADQRVEVVGLRDLLKYLTNDQFETVQRWIEEGEAATRATPVQ